MKAAKKAAPEKAKADAGPSHETVRRKKLELRKKVVGLAVDLLAAAARKKSDEVVLQLLQDEIGFAGQKLLTRVSEAFDVGFGTPPGPPGDVAAMLYLLHALPNAAGSTWGESYSQGFERACKLLSVDLKKLEAEAQKDKAAPEKTAAPKKGKKK